MTSILPQSTTSQIFTDPSFLRLIGQNLSEKVRKREFVRTIFQISESEQRQWAICSLFEMVCDAIAKNSKKTENRAVCQDARKFLFLSKEMLDQEDQRITGATRKKCEQLFVQAIPKRSVNISKEFSVFDLPLAHFSLPSASEIDTIYATMEKVYGEDEKEARRTFFESFSTKKD